MDQSTIASQQTIMKRMLEAGGFYFLQAIILLALHITISRWLGSVDQYGMYIFYYALIKMISVPALLGFNRAAVRFLPLYLADNKLDKVAGFLLFSLLSVLVCGFVLAFIVSHFLNSHIVSVSSSILFIFFVPLFSLAFLLRGFLKGFKLVILSVAPMSLLYELMALLAAFGIATSSLNIHTINAIVFVAIGVVLCVELLTLFYILPKSFFKNVPSFDIKLWLTNAIPMMISSSAKIIYHLASLIVVYKALDAKACGIYGTVIVLAKFISVPVRSMSIAANPYIATAKKDPNPLVLKQLITSAMQLSIKPMALMLVIAILLGKWILSAFGDAFTAGYLSLLLLMFAKCVGIWSGFGTSILNMAGFAKKPILPLIVAAVLNIILTVLFVKTMNITGAALAFLLTQGVNAVWFNFLCVKKLNLNLLKLLFLRQKRY